MPSVSVFYLSFLPEEGLVLAPYADAVLEHLYALPHAMRGRVERIVFGSLITAESGKIKQVVRVDGHHARAYSLFLFVERSQSTYVWRVIGQSRFFSGPSVVPTDHDVTWFDDATVHPSALHP